MKTEHVLAANGYSNLYWGWGKFFINHKANTKRNIHFINFCLKAQKMTIFIIGKYILNEAIFNEYFLKGCFFSRIKDLKALVIKSNDRHHESADIK